jgi:hypothetical protein
MSITVGEDFDIERISRDIEQARTDDKLKRAAIARHPHKKDCYIFEGQGFICSCGAEENRAHFIKRLQAWK